MEIKVTLLAETLAANLTAENSSGLDWTGPYGTLLLFS